MACFINQLKSSISVFDPHHNQQNAVVDKEAEAILNNHDINERVKQVSALVELTFSNIQRVHPRLNEIFNRYELFKELPKDEEISEQDDFFKAIEKLKILEKIINGEMALEELRHQLSELKKQNHEKQELISSLIQELAVSRENIKRFQTQVDTSRIYTLNLTQS